MTYSTKAITENNSISTAKIVDNVNFKYEEWKRARKLNQKLDVSLTLSTIFLGLLVVILSTEGIKMDDNFRKGSIGIIGGVISVGQAIATQFGIRKKAEGYRTIENQAMVLQNDIDIATNSDELLSIHKQLNHLILQAAAIERGD